jgi:oligopeptide/dipeptide ABC transporter ATP-binding protein
VAVMYQGMIIETATTDDLLDSPRHPYTQSLLAAIPEPEARRD